MAILPPNPEIILKPFGGEQINNIIFLNSNQILAATKKMGIFFFDASTHRSHFLSNIDFSYEVTSIHHENDTLITMEKEGIIKTHKYENSGYKLLRQRNLHYNGFCKTSLFSKDNLIYSPKDYNSIIGLTLDSLDIVFCLNLPENKNNFGTLSCLKYFSTLSKSFILSGYESGKVLLWDLKSLSILSEYLTEEYVTSIDYDPIKNRGVITNSSDKITIFTIDSNDKIIKSSLISIKNRGLNNAKIRKDAKIFCTAGWDSNIRVFSWKSLRQLAVLGEHEDSVLDVNYYEHSKDTASLKLMASGGADGKICIWKIY